MGLGADEAVFGAQLQHADEAQRPVQAQHLHRLAQPRWRGQIHDLSTAAHASAGVTPISRDLLVLLLILEESLQHVTEDS